MKIATNYNPKPIPMRGYDWCAIDADTYDGPGSPIGFGATEDEAVHDLIEEIAFKLSYPDKEPVTWN